MTGPTVREVKRPLSPPSAPPAWVTLGAIQAVSSASLISPPAAAATPPAAASERKREGGREMKGAGVGAAAPGDNVYFKSIVPLHKISVSSRAPRLPPSHVLSH